MTAWHGGGVAAGPETSEPEAGYVAVEVFASGLNPFAATPEADAHDIAGRIRAVGPGERRLHVGDEVLGWVAAGPHARRLLVPAEQLVRKPRNLSWEVAGALSVAGTAAWEAVEANGLGVDDTVVVTDAAGAMGCLVAQLAHGHGARVVAVADVERADFLRQFELDVVPSGDGLAERLREAAPEGVTVYFDCGGEGSGLGAAIGVAAFRIIDVAEVERRLMSASRPRHGRDGAKAKVGRNAERVALSRLVALFDAHRLQLPIADVYPFAQAEAAFRALGQRESRGAVVLGMQSVEYPAQIVHGIDAREQEYTVDLPTPHDAVRTVEAVPPAIGDGSVRRRRAAARAGRAEEPGD